MRRTLTVAILLAFASLARSQSAGPYHLIWSSVAGAGAENVGGSFAVSGAIG